MKNLTILLLVFTVLISCSKQPKSMLVKGEIKGLKKGTLYLKKVQDTILKTVDSIYLEDESIFELSDEIESPEAYYLVLNNLDEDKIEFFGEKGEFIINSKLDKFVYSAKIKGHKNQKLLEEHRSMISKFNNQQLDLIKSEFDAKKENDIELAEKASKDYNNLIKRKYLYTTNFAVQNAKYEVAPFLALTELYDANIHLLDTINNSLSKKVKASKYGKQLDNYITKIKETEN